MGYRIGGWAQRQIKNLNTALYFGAVAALVFSSSVALMSVERVQAAGDDVVINELSANGTEWVELYNTSSTDTVSLSGWKMTELSNPDSNATENSTSLSDSLGPNNVKAFDISNLNNDGDTVSIYNGSVDSNNLINRVDYGDQHDDNNDGTSETDSDTGSIGRATDGSSNWTTFSNPTENSSNTPATNSTETTPIPATRLHNGGTQVSNVVFSDDEGQATLDMQYQVDKDDYIIGAAKTDLGAQNPGPNGNQDRGYGEVVAERPDNTNISHYERTVIYNHPNNSDSPITWTTNGQVKEWNGHQGENFYVNVAKNTQSDGSGKWLPYAAHTDNVTIDWYNGEPTSDSSTKVASDTFSINISDNTQCEPANQLGDGSGRVENITENETFDTIQDAIDDCDTNDQTGDRDTSVAGNGTYTENVNIDKQVTVKSQNGPSSTTIKGQVGIESSNVQLRAFEITGSEADGTGVNVKGDYSDIHIFFNQIHDVGLNSQDDAEGIILNGGSDITIRGNEIYNIEASAESPEGILIGNNGNTTSNVRIDGNNEIYNIEGGPGAFGVLVNGDSSGLLVLNNTIRDVNADSYAVGLGLDENTANARIKTNDFSNFGGSGSATAVSVNNRDENGPNGNNEGNTVTVKYNNFLFNQPAVGVSYDLDSDGGAPYGSTNNLLDAEENYWNDQQGPSDSLGNGESDSSGALATPNVNYTPWLCNEYSGEENPETTTDGSCEPPSQPELKFPGNGDILNSDDLYIDWSDSSDDETSQNQITYEYRLYLKNPDENPNADVRYSEDYTGTTRHPAQGFASGTREDTYFWEVRACDEANNCSDWTEASKFIVDNTAPDTSWDAAGPVLAANDTPAFRGSSNDDQSDITNVELRIEDNLGKQVQDWLSVSASDGNFNATPDSALNDGTYTFLARGTDSAGNTETAPAELMVTIDTTGPGAEAGANQTVTGSQSTELDGTTNANDDVSFSWQQTAGQGNTSFGSRNSEDTTVSVSSFGTYTFELTVTDQAGNSDSDTVQVTFEEEEDAGETDDGTTTNNGNGTQTAGDDDPALIAANQQFAQGQVLAAQDQDAGQDQQEGDTEDGQENGDVLQTTDQPNGQQDDQATADEDGQDGSDWWAQWWLWLAIILALLATGYYLYSRRQQSA
jgi:hypothetical protein